jgi:hypothetical protein
MTDDLDVFLLEDCASDACIDETSFGEYEAVAHALAPGTYFVAVDGFWYSEGSFDLELTCTRLGVFLPLVVRNH